MQENHGEDERVNQKLKIVYLKAKSALQITISQGLGIQSDI